MMVTFDMIDVEIDYDGDGPADDWSYQVTDGTFEFSPDNHPGFGQLTFAVRVLEMDPATFEYTLANGSRLHSPLKTLMNRPPLPV